MGFLPHVLELICTLSWGNQGKFLQEIKKLKEVETKPKSALHSDNLWSSGLRNRI